MAKVYPRDVLTRSYLEAHYVVGMKSEQRIAKDLGLKSSNSVRQHIKKYGLKRKSLKPGVSHLTKEYLEEQYVLKNLGTRDIARELGVARITVRRALQQYGIPLKRGSVPNTAVRAAWKSRRRGHEGISGRYWATVVCGALSRELKITITPRHAWRLFLRQNGLCALTGLPLRFYEAGESPATQTASLDRIDSSRGYIRGNVQWVHKDLQRMKWAFSEQRFVELCEMVVRHRRKVSPI